MLCRSPRFGDGPSKKQNCFDCWQWNLGDSSSFQLGSLHCQQYHKPPLFLAVFFFSHSQSDMSNFNSPMRLSSSLIKHLKYRVRMGSNPLLPHSRSFTTTEGHRPIIVHKRSLDILHDPWFNKVTQSAIFLSICVLFCLICFLEFYFWRSISGWVLFMRN